MSGIAEIYYSPQYIHEASEEDLAEDIASDILHDICTTTYKKDSDDVNVLIYANCCNGFLSDFITPNKNTISCEKVFNSSEAAYTIEYECNYGAIEKEVNSYVKSKYEPVIKLANYIKNLDPKIENIINTKYDSVNELVALYFLEEIMKPVLNHSSPNDSIHTLFDNVPEVISYIDDFDDDDDSDVSSVEIEKYIYNCIDKLIEEAEKMLESYKDD